MRSRLEASVVGAADGRALLMLEDDLVCLPVSSIGQRPSEGRMESERDRQRSIARVPDTRPRGECWTLDREIYLELKIEGELRTGRRVGRKT
jgi:hypothetical protein